MNTQQIAKHFEKFTKRGQILSNLVALAVTQKRTKKPGCETCVEVTILPSTPQNKFRESLKPQVVWRNKNFATKIVGKSK